MPRGAKIGHPKGGGRVKGTPNRKTTILLDALEAQGCHLPGQIAGLLTDPALPGALKVDLVGKLLPYLYPQRKPMDPEDILTPAQAAGMLGAQATKFRAALQRYVADETLIAVILEALRAPTTECPRAGAPPV
jgi:hypothetical protein